LVCLLMPPYGCTRLYLGGLCRPPRSLITGKGYTRSMAHTPTIPFLSPCAQDQAFLFHCPCQRRGWDYCTLGHAAHAQLGSNTWWQRHIDAGGCRAVSLPCLVCQARGFLLGLGAGAGRSAKLRREGRDGGGGGWTPTAACTSRIFPMRSPRLEPTWRRTSFPSR